jgi:SEC-C motif
MASQRRNDPCSCGSGKKAKRCCGVHRGPGGEDLARAFLAVEARRALPWLVGLSEGEFRQLAHDLLGLPRLDLSLLVPLPSLVTPPLGRLLEALVDDDADRAEAALPEVLTRIDTAQTRASLARAVLTLRQSGRIAPRLAALALLDLDRGTSLLEASLINAAAIAAGTARTPAGLLVAAA